MVALADKDTVMGFELLPPLKSSECLIASVRRVLRGTLLSQLSGVGVVAGPGSFTGVRAGLSVAKGLCEAGGLKMVSMSRLELLALEQQERNGGVSILDAGRGAFFYGVYREGCTISEGISRYSELAALKNGDVGPWVTSELAVRQAVGDWVELVNEPGVDIMLELIGRRVRRDDWSQIADSDGNYLRRPDAEVATETL